MCLAGLGFGVGRELAFGSGTGARNTSKAETDLNAFFKLEQCIIVGWKPNESICGAIFGSVETKAKCL